MTDEQVRIKVKEVLNRDDINNLYQRFIERTKRENEENEPNLKVLIDMCNRLIERISEQLLESCKMMMKKINIFEYDRHVKQVKRIWGISIPFIEESFPFIITFREKIIKDGEL